MTEMMLDLETAGTGPTAAIIQIGAVVFALDDPLTSWTFERTVALQSSLFAGGSVDVATIDWWCNRPIETQEAVANQAVTLLSALTGFTDWFNEQQDPIYLWANGAAFDPPILESAYRSLGLPVPWKYSLVRDTRTLYQLATDLAGWVKPMRKTAHTALADAIAQTEDVRGAYAALRKVMIALFSRSQQNEG
jgi:exodeoxyribonuclease VIII